MICDGYTLLGQIGSKTFSYRPALTAERERVNTEVRFFQSIDYVESFIWSHVVWINSHDLTDMELRLMFFVCAGVAPPENQNGWRKDWERKDAENLRDGVILELTEPTFARRSCEDCQKWWYDDDTGKVVLKGKRQLLRPKDTVLRCQTKEGCPKGTPENQKTLTPKNRLAWKSYREWSAAGEFPDDPIVHRNALIIQQAIRKADGLRATRKRHG